MPGRDMEAIDLSTITAETAIKFIGRHTDGRVVELGVNVLKVGSKFAYGTTYATEETQAGSRVHRFDRDLCLALARLPRDAVIQGCSYDLDMCMAPQDVTVAGTHEGALNQVEWGTLAVRFEGLRLETTRSRRFSNHAAAILLNLA